MNNYFGYAVVERLKLISFEDEIKTPMNENSKDKIVTNMKYQNKINNVKNDKIKKSLIELTKVFKEK